MLRKLYSPLVAMVILAMLATACDDTVATPAPQANPAPNAVTAPTLEVADGETEEVIEVPPEVYAAGIVFIGPEAAGPFANGFRGVHIKDIAWPEGVNLPSTGWYRMKGNVTCTSNVTFCVLFNPSESRWAKVAVLDTPGAKRIPTAYSYQQTLLDQAGVSQELKSSLVYFDGASYTPKSGVTYQLVGYSLNHAGPSIEEFIRQAQLSGNPALAQQAMEEAWTRTVDALEYGGIYNRDPNPGNFLVDSKSGRVFMYDLEAASSRTPFSQQAVVSLWKRFRTRFDSIRGLTFPEDPFAIVERTRGMPGWFNTVPSVNGGQVVTTEAGVVEEVIAPVNGSGAAATVDDAAVAASRTAEMQATAVAVRTPTGTSRIISWVKGVAGPALVIIGEVIVIVYTVSLVNDAIDPLSQGLILESPGEVGLATFDGGGFGPDFSFDGHGELNGMYNALFNWKYSKAYEDYLAANPGAQASEIEAWAHEIATTSLYQSRPVMVKPGPYETSPTEPLTFVDTLVTPAGERLLVFWQMVDYLTATGTVQGPLVIGYYTTPDEGATWSLVREVPELVFNKQPTNGDMTTGATVPAYQLMDPIRLDNGAYYLVVMRTR